MNLPKAYDPKQYEPTIYGLWESSHAFEPTGVGEPYAIAMPPPNANGNLHIGHALTIALQDILVRHERMLGKDAIYLPGADHAGFETWVVWQKLQQKLNNNTSLDSREVTYAKVWDFVAQQRGNMELQVRALGAGVTWPNSTFTLDTRVLGIVYSSFKKLWDDGYIYRGERMVNYCTFHQTSFADIEVEHREEKSKLWRIAYPSLDKVREVIVATTRPETLLGDTAIAVNPSDPRYKDLIGTHVLVPLVNREIPIVGDEAVDPAFGTGAIKVTPAHDPTDFEIGKRHDLPTIQVIGFDGKITPEMGKDYAGLDIKATRSRIVEDLQAAEVLKGEEDYTHNVGHCYKCGTIIEPLLKEQWFLKVRDLADRAKAVITAGDITFTPASKADLVVQYLDNLHDWNLSRQIPWGIPIPAFQNTADPDDWIYDTRTDQPTITVDGKSYRREEDTFDTWFSSSQWPFVVTNATDSASDLARFYPTAVMETGHDLLDRWVSRMVMLGLYVTDKVPFHHVYMHGMVLDEHGQKMSKSKGNVINPMDVIETHGSDALRLGVVASRSAGQNQAFSTAKVVAGRNFCNKLWNIARFVEDKLGEQSFSHTVPEPANLADHWIIRQLDTARQTIDEHLAAYRFAEASDVVYHTIWDDVADWYIEASKRQYSPNTLAWVLATSLKLAHPFAPFVTETIWTTLKWDETLLARSAWPEVAEFHEVSAAEFEQIMELVAEIRYVASELPGGKQHLLYENDSLIADNEALVTQLARLEAITHIPQPKGLRLAVANREAWLKVDDETLYEHQTKLELRLVKCRESISRLEGRLGNQNYIAQAPAAVVEETRQQLHDQKLIEEKLVGELRVLE